MKLFSDLLISGFCLALVALSANSAMAKPLAPIQVSIEPVQSVVAGQPVEFAVRVRVSMDAENLHISVSVPPSVEITGGDLNWQGRLLRGEEKQLQFTAIANGHSTQTIEVRAFIVAQSPNDDAQNTIAQERPLAQFSAGAVYVMPFGGPVSAAAIQSSPLNTPAAPRIVGRKGRRIAEYPLER